MTSSVIEGYIWPHLWTDFDKNLCESKYYGEATFLLKMTERFIFFSFPKCKSLISYRRLFIVMLERKSFF